MYRLCKELIQEGKSPIVVLGFNTKEEIFYENEKFVRVLGSDRVPETRYVRGSNYADIGFRVDRRTNRLIMMGAIDNLVKGAAGQAVQNMNLMFGLQEEEGLTAVPMAF